MKRLMIVATTAAAAAILGACATASPDVVSPYAVQQASTVIDAVVLSVRPVTIGGTQTGIGAASGVALGSVAGSSVGGYRDSFAGAIVGAIVGGVVGNSIERSATTQSGQEIIVQLRNGERRAIVQAVGNETFATGDSVILIYTGGRVRVTKAPVTLMPASPAPAAKP